MNTFKFIRDGVEEEVNLEKWLWIAFYKDGTELRQFDSNGIFHTIGEINQDNLWMFTMVNNDATKRIDLVVPEGARIIHLYRNYTMNFGLSDQRKIKIYVFGYKHEGHHHYNYIMPNDTIIQSIDQDLPLTNFGLTIA